MKGGDLWGRGSFFFGVVKALGQVNKDEAEETNQPAKAMKATCTLLRYFGLISSSSSFLNQWGEVILSGF